MAIWSELITQEMECHGELGRHYPSASWIVFRYKD